MWIVISSARQWSCCRNFRPNPAVDPPPLNWSTWYSRHKRLKRHRLEEIVSKLHPVEVLVGQGMPRRDAIRQISCNWFLGFAVAPAYDRLLHNGRNGSRLCKNSRASKIVRMVFHSWHFLGWLLLGSKRILSIWECCSNQNLDFGVFTQSGSLMEVTRIVGDYETH